MTIVSENLAQSCLKYKSVSLAAKIHLNASVALVILSNIDAKKAFKCAIDLLIAEPSHELLNEFFKNVKEVVDRCIELHRFPISEQLLKFLMDFFIPSGACSKASLVALKESYEGLGKAYALMNSEEDVRKCYDLLQELNKKIEALPQKMDSSTQGYRPKNPGRPP